MRALIVLISVIACAVSTACASDQPDTLPADLMRLGNYRLATTEEAQGGDAISGEQAIASAAAFGYAQPGANAYLVVPMDPVATTRYAAVPGHTMVWIVRWTGVNEMGGVPAGPAGAGPSPASFQFRYVTVDAISGEVVDAAYME
jgi:hypothetical protein